MSSPDQEPNSDGINQSDDSNTESNSTQSPQPSLIPLNQTWKEISRRWKNSVLQLQVTYGRFDVYRPYLSPKDRKSSGTGFVIDIHRGFVLTNAHVVRNAFSIVARTTRLGSRDIPIKLYSISIERDLALCQLTIDGINIISEGIENPESLNVKFADDLFTQETDEVLTIGYPLGDEIKFTTGVISGFHRENNGDKYFEDAISRDPTYIQITAAINPGNSGGPLFNRKGKVIGINAAGFLFAQNTGYAIRSRIFLSIFSTLLRQEGTTTIPTWAFKWSPTNQAFFQASLNQNRAETCQPRLEASQDQSTNQEGQVQQNGGIYLRKIYPDSILSNQGETEQLEGTKISTIKGLKIQPSFDLEGSVLISIIYYDPFIMNPETFDPVKYQIDSTPFQETNQKDLVLAEVDYHGMFALYKINGERIIDRLVDLSEMVDLLPIPSDLTLQIYQSKKSKKSKKSSSPDQKDTELVCPYSLVKIGYLAKSVYRLERAQPVIKPFDYEIIAGLCLMDLMADHSDRNRELNCRYKQTKNRYKPALIVCQVFPGTEASRVRSINQFDLLKTFAGQKVTDLTELRTLIQKSRPDPFLRFTNPKGSILVVEMKMALEEDAQILEMFKIPPRYHSLSSGMKGN